MEQNLLDDTISNHLFIVFRSVDLVRSSSDAALLTATSTIAKTSFFTPPRGSQMSVWVSSLLSTQDVVNLILEKYKVESRPEHFALYVMRDSGEQRRLKDDDYPLLVRILLGPHEDVARIFLMDTQTTSEIRYLYLFNNRSTVVLKIVLIFFRSCEMAQFINLSVLECKSILDRYEEERQREENRIREK